MKNSVLNAFDPVIARWVIGAAMLLTVETLVVLGVIAYHIPYKADPALAEIFFHYRKGFMPERELQLYGCGIIMAVLFFLEIVFCFRQQLSEAKLRRSLERYVMLQGLLVLMELGIVVWLVLNPANQMAWVMMFGLLGVSVIIKIFYSEIDAWFGRTF